MIDDHILYNGTPCVYQKNTPKQRHKKSDAKKNINPKTQKSVIDVTHQTTPWNHVINNAEKKTNTYKKNTLKSYKNPDSRWVFVLVFVLVLGLMLMLVKDFFPKFKSPLQKKCSWVTTLHHKQLTTMIRWRLGKWFDAIQLDHPGGSLYDMELEPLKKMWSIMKRLRFTTKKASDIISCFSCYGSNLYTWIHFCWE